jgi:hypothetical protein
LPHLRENIADHGLKHSRQERQHCSGTGSFHDFSGAETGQFDYLVNAGKPAGTKKSDANFAFV